MAANTSAVFALTPNTGQGRTAGANTARDGSGSNIITIFTAGANGSRVDKIKVISAQTAAAASSTMVIRIGVTDNAGANTRLLVESVLTSATASTTVIGAFTVIDFVNGVTTNGTTITNNGFIGGIQLQTGQLLNLWQSIFAGAQDQNDITTFGGNF